MTETERLEMHREIKVLQDRRKNFRITSNDPRLPISGSFKTGYIFNFRRPDEVPEAAVAVRQLFSVEYEQVTVNGSYSIDVSSQLGNLVSTDSPPYYIPPTDFDSVAAPGTILGGFFASAFSNFEHSGIAYSVKADGVLISFGGNTTIIIPENEQQIIAADPGQIVTGSLVFEFSSGGNDQADIFVWGVPL